MLRYVLAMLAFVGSGCDRAPADAESPTKADTPVAKAIDTKAPLDAKVPDTTTDAKTPDSKTPDTKTPDTPPPPALAHLEAHTGGLWNDRAEGVALLHGGGFGVVGRCEPVESGRESEWNACVTFFDALGKSGASASLGGSGTDEIFESAIATTDGGLIAVGAVEEGGMREARAVRLGPEAKVQWERSWGGAGDDTALAIAATTDGYVVVGSSHQPEHELDVAVWWLDSQGATTRTQTFGGAAKDLAHAVVLVPDGLVVAGFTASKGAGKDDAWVLRLDAAGELAWDRTYGTAAHDGAYAITTLSDGTIVVAGDSDRAAWIATLDAKGEVLAQTRITTATKIRAVVRLEADVIVGVGTGVDLLKPAWLGRFDKTTTMIDDRVFEHPRLAATDAIATGDGGLVLVGNWPSIGSNYANFWLCKLDGSGGGCG